MRQVVLDTETTGLDPKRGHRIIEIGAVELIDGIKTGNVFHQYINPDRDIDPGAVKIHGITRQALNDKPRFIDIFDDFVKFIDGSELIIHNAPFDIGFLDKEIGMTKPGRKLSDYCEYAVDTLAISRKIHPGKRNRLDDLCDRYGVNRKDRKYHGALLDAELLADVYTRMDIPSDSNKGWYIIGGLTLILLIWIIL